jgi:hypothetical protein
MVAVENGFDVDVGVFGGNDSFLFCKTFLFISYGTCYILSSDMYYYKVAIQPMV